MMVDTLEALRAELADRYVLETELGRGAMGVVFRAKDVRHTRTVAVKVLRVELGTPQFADRFFREIEIAARLSHPHILPLHDSGRTASCLYYVTPYVEGQSLRDVIRAQRQLPIDLAVRLGGEIADALGYAHSQGTIHRDVKPENILVSNGHAVVADFGIATALSEGETATLTAPGVILGTPAYMSPEQASGAPVDGRSDVYSLGCVMYELLSGQPPFTPSSVQAILAQHISQAPPDVRLLRSDVPDGLAAAITRALAKVPEKRFGTAQEFGSSLRSGEVRSARPGNTRLRRSAAVAMVASIAAGGAFMAARSAWIAFRPPVIESKLMESPDGSASVRILETTPTPGTAFSGAQLAEGVRVHVALEHNVKSARSSATPTLSLLAQYTCPATSPAQSAGEVGPGMHSCWQTIDTRKASFEPMQLALEGFVYKRHVMDQRITLRVTVLFPSPKGGVTMAGSNLIEYVVRD